MKTFWTCILVGDVHAGTSRRIKRCSCWWTGGDQQINVPNSKLSTTLLNGYIYLRNECSLSFSLNKTVEGCKEPSKQCIKFHDILLFSVLITSYFFFPRQLAYFSIILGRQSACFLRCCQAFPVKAIILKGKAIQQR